MPSKFMKFLETSFNIAVDVDGDVVALFVYSFGVTKAAYAENSRLNYME
jgi:hypothetical protein